MRFESSTNVSSTPFSDQVTKVVDLFHEWNDCERSVAMYAILKRIPFACAKFLQSVIDTNLTQTYCLEQTKLLEHNANSATFIQRLSETYKNFKPTGNQSQQQLNNNKDSLFCESDRINIVNAGSSQQLITTNNDGGGGGGIGGSSNNIGGRGGSTATLNTRGGSGCDLVSGVGGGSVGGNNLNEISDKFYEKKEDILKDILTLMPILTPGNDEAKLAYLEFIPITVEDAIRGTVNATLVQQIFSYLLIHPAFTTNDRRSLSKFLRHLEEHIVSTDSNFVLYGNGAGSSSSTTSDTVNSTTIPSSSSSSSTNWQAIAPPQSKSTETILSWDGSQHHLTGSNNVISVNTSSGNLSSSASKTIICSNGAVGGGVAGSVAGVVGVSGTSGSGSGGVGGSGSSNSVNAVVGSGVTGVVVPFVVDDVTAEYQCSKSLVGNIIEFKSTPGSSPKLGLLYESTADDHDISFSKNGTEIIDFDCDDTDKSNTQIGFDTLANLNEFLTVPGIIDNITLKTRRSNSLTTTGSVKTASSYTSSSSAQNLNNLVQKPRSFSLSMVSPRSSLTSSGSDTRLDDFKPNYSKFTQHNIGMSNIGQWLKSLRLHKYVWLFSNITYDQMLDITEEYLQNLNVTKGARHKLVVCIQKLKERHSVLCQLEKDLMTNKVTFANALDELSGVVLTPMKPVEHLNKHDIGGQFLKVLNLVSTMITSKHITPQDEEPINLLLWILEKAVHNEAFVAHTNQLKEHRFKVSRIKVQFPPKSHFGNTNNNNNNTNNNGNGNNANNPNTINSKTTSSCSSSGNLTRSSGIFKLDYFALTRNFENTSDSRRLSIDSGYNTATFSSTESINLIQSPTFPANNKNLFNQTSSVGNKSIKSIKQSQAQPQPQQPIHQIYGTVYPNMQKLAAFAENLIPNESINNLAHGNENGMKIDQDSINNVAVLVDKFNITDGIELFNKHIPPPSICKKEDLLKLPKIKQQLKIAPEFIPANKRIIPQLQPPPNDVIFTPTNLPLPDQDRPTFASVTSGISTIKPYVSPLDNQFKCELSNIFKPQESLLNPLTPQAQKMGNSMAKNGLWMRPLNILENKLPPLNYGTLNNAIHHQYQQQQHQKQELQHHQQKKHQKPIAPPPIPGILKLGMNQVPIWLKGLRLHKYQWIFNEMSYENMLHLTEDYLESLNVTKGARNKLILSIKKLCDRYSNMDTMETELTGQIVVDNFKLKLTEILDELIYIVQTPMKPVQLYNSTDVANKFLKILNLVYEKIIMPPPPAGVTAITTKIRTFNTQVDDELIYKLAFLIDKALISEGFIGYIPKLRKMRQKLPDCKKYSRKD